MPRKTKPITEKELAKWEALCEKASCGPWVPNLRTEIYDVYDVKQRDAFNYDWILAMQALSTPNWKNDRDFIFAAREALPRLIRSYRDVLAAGQDFVKDCRADRELPGFLDRHIERLERIRTAALELSEAVMNKTRNRSAWLDIIYIANADLRKAAGLE